MDVQQIIALGIVGAAALYLGRNVRQTVRSLRGSSKGGCAGGCSNCAFAEKAGAAKRPTAAAPRSNIIPLTDIRALPTSRKPENGPR